jgi:hypothetical protein
MPDLRHMNDLFAIELHDVDVIRAYPTTSRWNRAARSGVGPVEYRERADIVPLGIGSKGLHLITSIGQYRYDSFHPVGVLGK